MKQCKTRKDLVLYFFLVLLLLTFVVHGEGWATSSGSDAQGVFNTPSGKCVDASPNAFHFLDQSNVPLNTPIKSNTIRVSGINVAVPISITGGKYSINGASYTGAPGMVRNGSHVNVLLMSSSKPSTATDATLTIGGLSDTFTVTTKDGLCHYTITPKNYGYSSANNTGIMVVTASSSSCSWTATSGNPWLTIWWGSSTTGSGVVVYNVAANATGGARTGIMNVAGEAVIIYQAKSQFADVSRNAYKPYIYATYSQGITDNCGGDKYCPSVAVSQGQAAALITKAMYGENSSNTTTPYVANADGILTKGEAAALIIRAKYGEDFSYTTTPYFADVPATNEFFKYVQKMKDLGYTVATGTYDVNGTVTRDQMAAFLGRAFLGME